MTTGPRFIKPPGVWVPQHLVMPEDPSPFFTKFALIRLGYKDLFGDRPTMDMLVKSVQEYSLGEVLELLAAVSHTLRAAESPAAPEAQAQVLDLLFGRRGPDLWTRAQTRRQGKEHIAVFGELQVLTLAKIAFLVCKDAPVRTSFNCEALGTALLMTNDVVLTHEDPPLPIGPDCDVLSDLAWCLPMFANTRFHQSKHALQEMARAAELFYRDRPTLHSCESYVDLPGLLARVTGLPPVQLWALLIGLLGRFQNNHGAEPRSALLAWLAKYPGTLAIEPFDRFVTPAADLQKVVLGSYSLDDLKLYQVLPFAQHPLIAVGDAVVCLSPQLLEDSLGVGVYHRLFDESLVGKETRAQCKQYVGRVFQDYMEDLFARVFPPSALARRWCPEDVLVPLAPKGHKLCDGVVVYEEAVVLVEAKASMLSVATLTGDPVAFARQIDDVTLDAAGQIDGTIASIREGCFERLGIMRTTKRFYPLVISLDSVGMNLWLRRYINDRQKQKGLLQATDTSVLHVMEIGELEFLEDGLISGERLDHVLERKCAQPLLQNSSFWNAWYLGNEPFLAVRNRYLEDVFRQRSEEVESWLRDEEPSVGGRP